VFISSSLEISVLLNEFVLRQVLNMIPKRTIVGRT